MNEKSIYDFTVSDIENNPVTFEKFRNKVLLIVNVASKCGFTSQYKGLQELYQEFKDDGFCVLGFPANNFLSQEPGADDLPPFLVPPLKLEFVFIQTVGA